MDNQLVISSDKKRTRDYLPSWLKNINSMFYYFWFLVFMGVVFFATSLFYNYFTIPFTGDYVMQQFAFYTNGYDDWWHFFRTGEFVLYDTNTFLGVDNIGSNSFYYLFDPFFMPILLCPRQLIPQGMAILTIFKIAASGMTFFLYMRYLGASRRASKITGFAYAFSGWMTWYLWFNHFTEIAIVLPLILLGVEMTIKEKKPWVLAASLCLMGFTNFFFLVCFAICAFLYAMFRYFQTIKTRNLKDNLFVLLFGFLGFLIGILMPMMVVLPAGMHAITAPRAATSSYSTYLKDAFKAKNLKEIFQLLTSWTAKSSTDQNKARSLYPFIDFIFPVMSDRGTPLTVLNNETYDNVAGSSYCFLPMMCLIVPAFIDSLNKRHFSVLVPLAFFLFALFTPVFYYLFHGFTEGYSRWTLFVTTSILAYTGLYLDKLEEKPFYVLIIGYASMIIMVAIGGVSAYYITKSFDSFKERTPIWLVMSLEAIYLTVLMVTLVCFKHFKKAKFYGVFTGFIAVEVALMGGFVIDGHGVNDYIKVNKGLTKNNVLHELVSRTSRLDKSYYRSYSSLASETAYNDSMRNGYNGANFFHSIYNFNTADICNWSSITGGDSPFSWSGTYLQKRVNLDTLLGIKYYYVEDDYFNYQGRSKVSSEDFRYNVPFQYLDVTSDYPNNQFRVYKNMDYIDFALTYDKVFETFGNPLKDRDNYELYSDVGSKNVLLNEELYVSGAIINSYRDDTIIDEIKNNYPDIEVTRPMHKIINDYYKVVTWTRYNNLSPYSTSDAAFTYYDTHSAGKTSMGLSAKDYLELCNRDNDKFEKTGYPASDGSNMSRRYVVVIDALKEEYLPTYDPNGMIYFVTANFESGHDVDIYFVDTNNEIVTYDNHNDGYFNGTRNGKNMRAFYITPKYEMNDDGELIMSKPAPKIKKIIIAQRSSKIQSSYNVYAETFTNHKVKMDALKAYMVTDVKSSANKYSFKTNFDKNRVIVTRLAYEDGFKVKMTDSNGKKQNLKVFNGQGGFVSFISGKGECKYVLEFETPYMAISSLISSLAVFTFLTTFVAYFYYGLKKEQNESIHLFRNKNTTKWYLL